MKQIALHGTTAAEACDLGFHRNVQLVDDLDLSRCAASSAELAPLKESAPALMRPLHIVAPTRNARRDNATWKSHLLTRKIPRNSFFMLEEAVYVEAPYLYFTILAARLSLPYACLLGMELCGAYSTHPSHRAMGRTSPGKGYYERNALTTVALLDRYTEAAGLNRRSMAKKACRFIVDGSRSPRESILHLLMRIDRKHGGYGFTRYLMNERIPLPLELAALMGQETLQLDFYWKDCGIAVEYDGKDFHSSDKQRSYDNIRRTALRQLGIQVITVDKWQMADMDTLDAIMGMVAQAAKEPALSHDADSRQARMNLRAELLAPGIDLYG